MLATCGGYRDPPTETCSVGMAVAAFVAGDEWEATATPRPRHAQLGWRLPPSSFARLVIERRASSMPQCFGYSSHVSGRHLGGTHAREFVLRRPPPRLLVRDPATACESASVATRRMHVNSRCVGRRLGVVGLAPVATRCLWELTSPWLGGLSVSPTSGPDRLGMAFS